MMVSDSADEIDHNEPHLSANIEKVGGGTKHD